MTAPAFTTVAASPAPCLRDYQPLVNGHRQASLHNGAFVISRVSNYRMDPGPTALLRFRTGLMAFIPAITCAPCRSTGGTRATYHLNPTWRVDTGFTRKTWFVKMARPKRSIAGYFPSIYTPARKPF